MHRQHVNLLIRSDLATQKHRESLELSRAKRGWSNIDVHAGIHLYLTSKRVESSSSSLSSLRGAISTRSAGVVIMSYFRVFLIRLPDLTTLMTRHVMRTAVNTQMKITMFFRVGRCVIRDEIRDPTAASVTLCVSSSSLMIDDDDDDDVEFNCVAGEERVCGSPLTRQRAAIMKVKARLYVIMMLEEEDAKTGCSFSSFSKLGEVRQQLSHHRRSDYSVSDFAIYTIKTMWEANIHLSAHPSCS